MSAATPGQAARDVSGLTPARASYEARMRELGRPLAPSFVLLEDVERRAEEAGARAAIAAQERPAPDGKTAGQLAKGAFYGYFGTDANNGVEELDEQHRPAWEAAARAVETAVRGRMLALAADCEQEAFAIAPASAAPDDAPDMADQIRAEVLSDVAERIRRRLDL